MTTQNEPTNNIDDREKKLITNEFKKIPWYLISGALIVASAASSLSHYSGQLFTAQICIFIGCAVMLVEVIKGRQT